MTALFKTPKAPKQVIEQTPATPTIDDAQRAKNETERLRRRRGTAGNIFAGGLGLTTGAGSAPGKTLTGQ
jgi:hypothetical protein